MTNHQLCFTLSLLIPFSLEEGLRITTNAGNMALHGALLDIYYKRNFVYISTPLCIVSSIFGYAIFGGGVMATSLFFYVRTCNKWYPYFLSAYR
jgi:hypothetical protein